MAEIMKIVVVNFPVFAGLVLAIWLLKDEVMSNRETVDRLIEHIIDSDEDKESVRNGQKK